MPFDCGAVGDLGNGWWSRKHLYSHNIVAFPRAGSASHAYACLCIQVRPNRLLSQTHTHTHTDFHSIDKHTSAHRSTERPTVVVFEEVVILFQILCGGARGKANNLTYCCTILCLIEGCVIRFGVSYSFLLAQKGLLCLFSFLFFSCIIFCFWVMIFSMRKLCTVEQVNKFEWVSCEYLTGLCSLGKQ